MYCYENVFETQDYNVVKLQGKYEVERVGLFSWQVTNTPFIFHKRKEAQDYKERLENKLYYIKKE